MTTAVADTQPEDTTAAAQAHAAQADAAALEAAAAGETPAATDADVIAAVAQFMSDNKLDADEGAAAEAASGPAAENTKPNTPAAGEAATEERNTPADGASIPAGGERQPPAQPDAALLRRAQLHAIEPSEWNGNVDVLRSLVTFADRRAADAALRTTDATKTAGNEPPDSKTPRTDRLAATGLYDEATLAEWRAEELEIKELRRLVESQQTQTQEQRADLHYGSIDAEVGKLDEELFGKGGFTEVSAAAQAERRRVAKLVDRMIEDHEEAGEKWDYPTVVQAAYAARHADRVAKKAADQAASELTEKLGKRKGTPTGRPSNDLERKAPTKGDDRDAVDAVRKFMVENGIPMT